MLRYVGIPLGVFVLVWCLCCYYLSIIVSLVYRAIRRAKGIRPLQITAQQAKDAYFADNRGRVTSKCQLSVNTELRGYRIIVSTPGVRGVGGAWVDGYTGDITYPTHLR